VNRSGPTERSTDVHLFLDCETTGLPPRRGTPPNEFDAWPRLVQVAWALHDDEGNRLSFDSRIVRPDGFEIPLGASNVHGITTDRALAEGEEVHGVLDALADAAAGASLVIAHNAAFDGPVVAAEYFRMGRTPPFDPKAMFCTMETGKHFTKIPGRYGDYKWPTLDELHRGLFLEGFDGAHDAGADVAACARCYYGLRQRGFPQ